ncbi:MAG TPA: TIGR02300 family protein [Rhodospirillales bacterium]|nr:TIGR02300 family protein [Rhodospirillales bacterium]
MAKVEWGTKRTCHSCGARFYDLRREPIVCPVCSTVHDPERQPKPRRPGPLLKEEPILAPHLADEDTVADDEVVEAETADVDELEDAAEAEGAEDELATEDGELMEDTSELGEDDDDIGEVMEHVDDEIEDKP